MSNLTPYLKNFIFDLDGTLVDSFSAVLAIFKRIAPEFGFQEAIATDLESLRALNSRELLRRLKIPLYQLPRVLTRTRKELATRLLDLPCFAQLPEVLRELVKRGFSLSILTSNSAKNVKLWLAYNELSELFSFVEAKSSFLGKKTQLKKIISKYQLDKSQTCYIGDETRDLEAAQANQILAVAVTWGFSSEKILAAQHPEKLLRVPADLLTLSALESI